MSSLPARVRPLAEEIAAALGLEVLDVKLSGGGRGRVLDVVVDGDEPVGSEQTARLAKELSRALDEADPIRGAYTLQVGTPGLDRPLRTARDFRRQLGRQIEVVVRDAPATPANSAGPDGAPPGPTGEPGVPPVLRGVVRGVTDDEVTLEAGGEQHRLRLDGIDHGKVVLPW